MTRRVGAVLYGRGGAIAVRRVVNDHIAETAAAAGKGTDESLNFFCECGDLGCLAIVEMTIAEYQATEPGFVRAHA